MRSTPKLFAFALAVLTTAGASPLEPPGAENLEPAVHDLDEPAPGSPEAQAPPKRQKSRRLVLPPLPEHLREVAKEMAQKARDGETFEDLLPMHRHKEEGLAFWDDIAGAINNVISAATQHTNRLMSVAVTEIGNVADDAGEHFDTATARIEDAGGIVADAVQEAAATTIDTVTNLYNEVYAHAELYWQMLASFFRDLCVITPDEFAIALAESIGPTNTFNAILEVFDGFEDFGGATQWAAKTACAGVWEMMKARSVPFASFVTKLAGKCSTGSGTAPAVSLGLVGAAGGSAGYAAEGAIEYGIAQNTNGIGACYIGGCVTRGLQLPPTPGAGVSMSVAVTVWLQDGLYDIPGEIGLIAGGLSVNIPVPGVGSGGLGGGASYFYTPTPGDTKGIGFDIEVAANGSPAASPVEVSFGAGKCFTPLCITEQGHECKLDGTSFGIENGYPWPDRGTHDAELLKKIGELRAHRLMHKQDVSHLERELITSHPSLSKEQRAHYLELVPGPPKMNYTRSLHPTAPGQTPPLSLSSCSNTCNYASDYDCDDGGPGSEYSICSLGTDCADCGTRGGGGSHYWQSATLQYGSCAEMSPPQSAGCSGGHPRPSKILAAMVEYSRHNGFRLMDATHSSAAAGACNPISCGGGGYAVWGWLAHPADRGIWKIDAVQPDGRFRLVEASHGSGWLGVCGLTNGLCGGSTYGLSISHDHDRGWMKIEEIGRGRFKLMDTTHGNAMIGMCGMYHCTGSDYGMLAYTNQAAIRDRGQWIISPI